MAPETPALRTSIFFKGSNSFSDSCNNAGQDHPSSTPCPNVVEPPTAIILNTSFGLSILNSVPLNPWELISASNLSFVIKEISFSKNFSISFSDENFILVLIIPSFTRNCIAFTNSVSEIESVAHHPAVFFIQLGTFSSADTLVAITPNNATARTKNSRIFINTLISS